MYIKTKKLFSNLHKFEDKPRIIIKNDKYVFIYSQKEYRVIENFYNEMTVMDIQSPYLLCKHFIDMDILFSKDENKEFLQSIYDILLKEYCHQYDFCLFENFKKDIEFSIERKLATPIFDEIMKNTEMIITPLIILKNVMIYLKNNDMNKLGCNDLSVLMDILHECPYMDDNFFSRLGKEIATYKYEINFDKEKYISFKFVSNTKDYNELGYLLYNRLFCIETPKADIFYDMQNPQFEYDKIIEYLNDEIIINGGDMLWI